MLVMLYFKTSFELSQLLAYCSSKYNPKSRNESVNYKFQATHGNQIVEGD